MFLVFPAKEGVRKLVQYQAVVPGRPAGPGAEPMNTCFANLFAGLYSWFPGSRAGARAPECYRFGFSDSLESRDLFRRWAPAFAGVTRTIGLLVSRNAHYSILSI